MMLQLQHNFIVISRVLSLHKIHANVKYCEGVFDRIVMIRAYKLVKGKFFTKLKGERGCPKIFN